MQQLDLFSKEELQTISAKAEKASEMSDRVRRGVFARLTPMEKKMTTLEENYATLQKEMQILREMISGRNEMKVFELKEACI